MNHSVEMQSVNIEEQPVTEHRFVHRAMACDWELRLACDDATEADHASQAVFDEIDRLELELSCFIESSDIARLGDLRAGHSLIVGDDAIVCLDRAKELFAITGGAFDPSLGRGLDRLRLDRRSHRVTVEIDGLALDLGGIGKGHAVDSACAELADWDVESGVITSGQSTVRAFGATHTLAIRDPRNHEATLARIALHDRTFSGSGTQLHGRHIVDPRTGKPASGPIGSWALAANSALSDALSTTFMIVDPDDIPGICHRIDGAAALWLTPAGDLQSFGDVPWA